MDQGKRSRIVFIAIGLFIALFGIFLFQISQKIRPTTVSMSSISSNIPSSQAVPSFTPSPFQPLHQTTIKADQTLPTAITPLASIASPTPTTLQIIQPQLEGTTFPIYIVQEGDQLENLAESLNLSPASIRNANFMYGDAIMPGQALIIPQTDPFPEPIWRFASLDKDMGNVFYPLFFSTNRYQMHYMPNTYPSVDPVAVTSMLDQGILFIEDSFGKPLDFNFDVYVVGTLFEQPNTYLLGRSFSLDRKIYVLYNGGGDTDNQQYLATHELTHLYAWNTFGQPVSFLVSEGAAVYIGMKMIADSHYMPIKTICAIYKREGHLPSLAEKTSMSDFRGHNNNLVNYYSSGCFVAYLIETYGADNFGFVYGTNDYEGIYGKSLDILEQEWKDSISVERNIEGLETKRFVNSVDTFMAVNQNFFAYFTGSKQSILAYGALDKARLTLLAGNLDAFDQYMLSYQAAMSQ